MFVNNFKAACEQRLTWRGRLNRCFIDLARRYAELGKCFCERNCREHAWAARKVFWRLLCKVLITDMRRLSSRFHLHH
jgi:hypothetical protein